MFASIMDGSHWLSKVIGTCDSCSWLGSVFRTTPFSADGAYPERHRPPVGRLDRALAKLTGGVVRRVRLREVHAEQLLPTIATLGKELASRSSGRLREVADELRMSLRREGLRAEGVARAFALVREAARRELGQSHFDVQLVGGQVMLRGMVAEMETGEGKTLTATLPACTAALAGIPVHIITVNDYLAQRDSEWMGPVYKALGLTVGLIVHGVEPEERRAAYRCDVTYGTNKEVAFDYLRDRIVLAGRPRGVELAVERLAGAGARSRRLLHRGLHYAIVDEADSVLVDEARTPLIISGPAGRGPEREIYQRALAMAGRLKPGRDFLLDERERSVRLTPVGQSALDQEGSGLPGIWGGRRWRQSLVCQALTASHLIRRDHEYLVQEGKIQIVDEYTGRLMADRSWEHGLHQMLEVKEGCSTTARNDPLARISYQRYFRRYLRLAGMTGTAREVAGELWAVYGLPVMSIATNRPLRRRGLRDRVYLTGEDKWSAVVRRIAALHTEGRPVLAGTRSVAASDRLSTLLRDAGMSPQVLNARQDREEAAVVARAGEVGQITVATNMAGRGTDIRLTPEVRELGGLHVIGTERHDARRIDRQLFGRCGRQGDPGSYEMITSLEDQILRPFARAIRLWQRLVGKYLGARASDRVATRLIRAAQRAAERRHAAQRHALLDADERLETTLAFAGRGE
jgi:preprotein translocase subunit SecA